jgi:hypothetical protein
MLLLPKPSSVQPLPPLPGWLVCLLPCTYELDSSFAPARSGAASAWIVYKSCGDGLINFVWTGTPDASPMFKLGSGQFPSGPSYVEFRGLHLDGCGNAGDGFFCRGGLHLRFIDNTVTDVTSVEERGDMASPIRSGG